MANKTWVELAKSLRREAGVQGDGPTDVVDQSGIYANLVQWTAQAWIDIAGLHDSWKFLWKTGTFTTTTATNEYAVDADLRQIEPSSIVATKSTEARRLELMDYARMRDLYNTVILDDDLDPRVLSVRPDGYFVFPEYTAADWVVTYEYGARATPFSVSSSAPTWPQEFDNVIVFKALIDYGMFYNAPEAVQHGQGRYSELLSRLKEDQLIRPQIKIGRFIGGGRQNRNRFI